VPGLKISILQQPLVWMDGPANLRHFDRQLEEITGRDVIVLPEMFTTGFAMEAAKQSMPQEGGRLDACQSAADQRADCR
jgi:predicted amidohydrolase